MAKEYIRVKMETADAAQAEMLIAWLSEVGYHGFEEEDGSLTAFMESFEFDEKALHSIIQVNDIKYSLSYEKEINWNEIWESSFEPVTIPGFVSVRAHFHSPVKGVEHEIIITPKMSFGTGHHATTHLMMQRMQKINMVGKKVLDFGTGTGILAILAEKSGALSVDAIDNDPQCILSSEENIRDNGCYNIRLWQYDRVPPGHYDIILANINKHILMESAERLAESLSPNGILIISGLLMEDEHDICSCYQKWLDIPDGRAWENNWLCLTFTR